MEIQRFNVPEELKRLARWTGWKFQDDEPGKKPKKFPLDPKNGGTAKSNDPSTWGTFDQAFMVVEDGRADGLNFVAGEGIMAVDLDSCRNIETQAIEPWAEKIMARLNTYAEASPSGTGIRLICYGSLPEGGRKKGNIEFKTTSFFSVTGWRIGKNKIEKREKEIRAFHAELFPPVIPPQPTEEKRDAGPGLKDEIVLEKCRGSEKFKLLWAGNWNGYPSQSEGDLALCSILAFYGQNSEQVDRLFRTSGLMRPKWDEKHFSGGRTYGEETVRKAIEKSAAKDTGPGNSNQARLTPGQDLTDMGNSLRMAVATHGNYRHCVEFGKWLHWTGQKWQIDNDGEIFRLARSVVRQLHIKAGLMQDHKDAANFARWAITSQSEARISAMLSLCESEPGIPIHADDLDQDPWLFNVGNGTLELKKNVFREHRREDLITKMAPVEYRPDVECSFWMEHLNRIFAKDPGLISFLQLAFGYSLTAATDERCLFISHGSGANGKTVTHETFAAILGDYAARTPTETLLAKRTGSIPNDLARLKGTRFVYCSEAEEGKRLAESMVKDITGGDKVSARFLHKEWFDYFPGFKVWLASNHKPEIRGTDDAIWARVRLIPFNVVIPEDERIPRSRILEKLIPEYPGILAWGVQGCREWLQYGLFTPDAVKAATLSYRAEMDLIGNFLDACCFIDKKAESSAADLYSRFKKWCEANGERDFSQKRFGARLGERGFTQSKLTNNRISWRGIGLLAQN